MGPQQSISMATVLQETMFLKLFSILIPTFFYLQPRRNRNFIRNLLGKKSTHFDFFSYSYKH
jgi:hypothetical protein